MLRAALLALLVLGVVAKPVLVAIGEAHAAEHALLAAADSHGAHGHGDHDDDGDPGTDHTQGAHGLMHQGGAGPSFAPMVSLPTLAAEALPQVGLPPDRSAPRATRASTTPFRPPIA